MAPSFQLQLAGEDSVWWSTSRARLCLYGAACLIAATWILSYSAWLSEGCMRVLPFVSDFGLEPHRRCFSLGMSTAAVLLTPCWFDYRDATAKHFELDSPRWQWLHWSIAPLGLWCSAAILSLAAHPEDTDLIVHVISAFALFIGSVLFSTLTTVLDARRGLPCHASLIVFFVSFSVLIAGTACIIKSVMLWREPGRIEAGEKQVVTFHMYCSGQQVLSLHYDFFGNLAAVFEWALLLNVTGLSFYKMHVAIGTHGDPIFGRHARGDRAGTVMSPHDDQAGRVMSPRDVSSANSRAVDAGTAMTPRDRLKSVFEQAYGSCKGP